MISDSAMRTRPKVLFTVGHSDHSLDHFVSMLRNFDVTAVADVRSSPFSRFTPQFNEEVVRAFLKKSRIYYVPLGAELGARRVEQECYVEKKARYELIAKTPMFERGLDRLRHGLEQHRIALMCAEKDPITCHRAILVARHLRSPQLEIAHILANGALEESRGIEDRLLDLLRASEGDLFGDRQALVERAYDLQAEKIAYVGTPPTFSSIKSEVYP